MYVPYVGPVPMGLLFLQSIFLLFHYSFGGFWGGDEYIVYMFPILLLLFGLVIKSVSDAVDQHTADAALSRETGDKEISLYPMMQLASTTLLLITLIIFIYYLDEDTDMPSHWVTTTLFVFSIFSSITFGLIYFRQETDEETWATVDFFDPILYIISGALIFSQGILLWLYDSPWGNVIYTSLWVITLPTLVLILLLLYGCVIAMLRKYKTRTRSFVCLSIMFLILYVYLSSIIYLEFPSATFFRPKWTCLISTIATGLLFILTIYIKIKNGEVPKMAARRRKLARQNIVEPIIL